MKKVFVRAPYNYDVDEASREAGLLCCDVSLTKQSFTEECDINTIVRRFGLMGQLPEQPVRMPTYEDFTDVVDFQTAMNVVRQAQESFMAMPADVRARFANDPQRFLEFCGDEKNREEARKLGLLVPEEGGKGGGTTPPVDKSSGDVVANKGEPKAQSTT